MIGFLQLKNIMKKILAISIIILLIIVAPFFVAKTSGATFIESLIFVPISILSSSVGAFIGIFCFKLIKK